MLAIFVFEEDQVILEAGTTFPWASTKLALKVMDWPGRITLAPDCMTTASVAVVEELVLLGEGSFLAQNVQSAMMTKLDNIEIVNLLILNMDI
jgi:hypothetical protein